jgi:hypothetical protein
MRHAAAVVLGASCAVVALCPADSTDTAAASEPAGLHATLQRSRLFETRRSLRLALRTTGDDDVQLQAIQLRSPFFDRVPPQPRDPLVVPGGAPVAMPLEFGDPRCDGATDGTSEVMLDTGDDEIVVVLDESPPGLLAELHEAECAVLAVREDADIRLGDTWERTGPRTVTGEVEVSQRRQGATVTVAGLEGNVIFHLDVEHPAGTSAPVLEVSDRQPSDRVAVTLTASRCDPHALIEYKRTFVYVALVDVGGDRPLRVDIPAEGNTRAMLEDLLAACIG